MHVNLNDSPKSIFFTLFFPPKFEYQIAFHIWNHINRVMVTVFSWSVVDHEFKSLSSKSKSYKIGICSFFAELGRKRNYWFEITIMRLGGATCLPTELNIIKIQLIVGLVQSGYHYHRMQLLIWR